MGSVVNLLGRGGQRFAEEVLGWNRVTIHKGQMVPRWKRQFDLHTLVINADNGPEGNGHRTQWLKRLVELCDAHQLTIRLAYYPPYHSKYNPVERLWGVLENHWRGEVIDSVDKTLGFVKKTVRVNGWYVGQYGAVIELQKTGCFLIGR